MGEFWLGGNFWISRENWKELRERRGEWVIGIEWEERIKFDERERERVRNWMNFAAKTYWMIKKESGKESKRVRWFAQNIENQKGSLFIEIITESFLNLKRKI
jgi:hypothetical protein